MLFVGTTGQDGTGSEWRGNEAEIWDTAQEGTDWQCREKEKRASHRLSAGKIFSWYLIKN